MKYNLKKLFLILLLLLYAANIMAHPGKEMDFDVNYQEFKVPTYQLPELMVTSAIA